MMRSLKCNEVFAMVKELLRKGKCNAITTGELMKTCHLASRRDLTAQIAKERAAGAIICSTTSGQGGYYLPDNRGEVIEFINSMNNRALNTFRAITAAREYLEQIDGQISLEIEQERELHG